MMKKSSGLGNWESKGKMTRWSKRAVQGWNGTLLWDPFVLKIYEIAIDGS